MERYLPKFSEGIIELLKEAYITVNPSSEPPILKKPIKFSRIWKVTMAGKSREEKEDWTITFFDAKEMFGQEVILKAEFMDDLFEKLKEVKQYHFVQNVRSVLSSSGDDLSKKALYILLATSDEKNLKFGVILGQIKDGGLHVIALWPESLAQAISVDKDIFYSFINRIIKKSDWFSDMNVVTFLPDETGKNKEKKELPDEPSTLPDYYT